MINLMLQGRGRGLVERRSIDHFINVVAKTLAKEGENLLFPRS